ncbi:MAG: HlyD family efflux transporter periplasmic adaptor subunit [Magnetococcales bacterium]|nr:HlyD family efflux transporter periplasmic adaptor subunit [Magnetococcales bacterium]NGZ07404.1 HlyD family efflux transporter periplasmic adaptor subunit [Magnetococcales bacterium]
MTTPVPMHIPPRSGRFIIPFITVSMIVLVIWADWAELDQIVRARGAVIPTSRNQVIQVMEMGMVDQILVQEGEFVKKGQTLLLLDKVRAEAGYLEVYGKVVAAMTTVARLTAEVFGNKPNFPKEAEEFPEVLANQKQLFQKRQSALNEDLKVMQDTLELVQKELSLMEPLLTTGDVSQVEILRLKRQQLDWRGKIINRKNRYLEDCQAELSKAQEGLEALTQQLTQHRKLRENTEIISPMDGVVRNIRITTKGGVARSGEEVMQVVPVDDEYLIEAKVLPADIAFVRTGLPANVQFDAWDYTIYGTFPGVVDYISVDTLEEAGGGSKTAETFYRVRIKIAGKDFVGMGPEPVKIQTGMTSVVEIITGKNTVLSFLTKPIAKTLHESMGER